MSEKAEIFYKDIGDYLSREEKLRIVSEGRSMLKLLPQMTRLTPNEHGDWISQRNDAFSNFIPIEPLNKFDAKTQSFFTVTVVGVATGRDAWVFNFSKDIIAKNMKRMIAFYNEQRIGFQKIKQTKQELSVIDYVDDSPFKISWTRSLRNAIEKNVIHKFSENEMRVGLYRPFTKQFLYYDRPFIESPGLWSQFFPIADIENIVICLNGPGGGKGFGCLITDTIPDYHSVGDTHCFPLYWYEKKPVNGKWVEQSLFVDDHSRFTTSHLPSTNNEYIRRDGVSDFILDQAQTRYGPRVVKEDIFYYVYGILHSPDYRKTFASDLKKTLPRLPLVEKTADFWAFSDAGRKLAALHLNYEDQPPLEGVLVNGEEASSKSPHTTYNLPPTTYNLPPTTYNLPLTTYNLPPTTSNLPPTTYQITKMTFPAKGQKDTIKYNADITITNIPAKAYEYVVNGKSAIEWIMERYAVTTHKESGITNDPNDSAIEHNNPRYILDLLLSVISVSVETVDIVAGLPEAEWK